MPKLGHAIPETSHLVYLHIVNVPANIYRPHFTIVRIHSKR